MLWLQITVAFSLLILVTCLGGGDDRFFRKYAMLKIQESCFGPDVITQIKKAMKEACLKCSCHESATPSPPTVPSRYPTTLPPKIEGGIADPENTIFANAQSFDLEKLNAILAYRPNAAPVSAFRPFQGPNHYSAFSPQTSMYFPPPPYQPQPFGYTPYNLPFFTPQYYGGQRTARNMDIKSQLETLTSKVGGRVKNITCVMQELGYLDEKLEPNFERIKERVRSLPVSEELKSDIEDGVTFCQQFSQCVPDINRDKSPLSSEMIRPMFFFKCYKHKKLEACIMKDIREKYTGVSEEDFDGAEIEFRRNGKAMKMRDDVVDTLASSLYEFFYGTDGNLDVDGIM